MNVAGHTVCVYLGFVGGVYALWVLFDCYRQSSMAETCDTATGRSRKSSRFARMDWLCQLFVTAAFLIVASTILIAIVRQDGQTMFTLSVADAKPTLGVEVPGMQALPPGRVFYSHNGKCRVVIGADLSSLPITDDELRALVSYCPQLDWLNLNGTSITDKGLEHLVSLRNLKSLTLSHTRITNKGLKHVASYEHLENLALDGTRIDDTSLHALIKLDRLQYLRLRHTDVSSHAVEDLMSKVPRLIEVTYGNGNGPVVCVETRANVAE